MARILLTTTQCTPFAVNTDFIMFVDEGMGKRQATEGSINSAPNASEVEFTVRVVHLSSGENLITLTPLAEIIRKWDEAEGRGVPLLTPEQEDYPSRA